MYLENFPIYSNEPIQSVNEQKDLGITFNSQLKFHTQTALAVRKANRILALINWCFNTLDDKSFITLYKTLVRPILKYGNTIYSPYYQGDINLVQSVQRRARKLVHSCHDLPYVERLCYLELPTLAYRRYMDLLILVYIFPLLEHLTCVVIHLNSTNNPHRN